MQAAVHGGEQRLRLYRAKDELGCPQHQSLASIAFRSECRGDKDEWNAAQPLVGLYPSDQVVAGPVRHDDVRENEVGQTMAQIIQRRTHPSGSADEVARAPEQAPGQLQVLGPVIDHQNGGAITRRSR